MSQTPPSPAPASPAPALPPLPPRIFDAHNHGRGGSDGSDLVALMDAHGIDRAAVLGLPAGPNSATNEVTLNAVRRQAGRLIGGVYVDPRDSSAVEEIRRYHGEGFRLVKLFPNHGYYPDDDALRPFFAEVAKLGMAVQSHCGWLFPSPGADYASYYSHPGRFEKVIRIHPETIFILAHMGGIAGFLESVMLTTRTPNTYVDCSPGQGLWALEYAGPLLGAMPPGRLLWGCDSYDYADYIPRYHAALVKAGFGQHLAGIFHDNADGLLRRIGAI
jgi:predicted TIM-barrel fold metal-dependent hydrolase